jgi:hypothetical protein
MESALGNSKADWSRHKLTLAKILHVKSSHKKEVKSVAQVQLDTFLLETHTNSNGRFSIAHGLEVFSPDGTRIDGIVVAVQHQNNNWHTLEGSNTVDNRFWWNETIVQGRDHII